MSLSGLSWRLHRRQVIGGGWRSWPGTAGAPLRSGRRQMDAADGLRPDSAAGGCLRRNQCGQRGEEPAFPPEAVRRRHRIQGRGGRDRKIRLPAVVGRLFFGPQKTQKTQKSMYEGASRRLSAGSFFVHKRLKKTQKTQKSMYERSLPAVVGRLFFCPQKTKKAQNFFFAASLPGGVLSPQKTQKAQNFFFAASLRSAAEKAPEGSRPVHGGGNP